MMGLVSNAQGLDDPIHGPYTMTVDSCAACHRAHTGKGPVLFKTTGSPQSTLCFTCHDGTGSQYNVKNAYQTAPVNDPATRTYYTHDATVATNHAISTEEFKGVLNRHTECSDCHNPHSSTATLSTQAITGWTPSGRMLGVPGVAVVNHAAGTTPDYTYLDGTITPTTAEYQLCFKCHSSYTNLPSNTGFTQSQYLLDKAVEFNPSNLSFHPVEAQGTNQTTKMAASLSGTSAYKIWNFTTTSTIRCSNCHAPSAKTGSGAGQTLDTHTSANAGILLLPYRDRILKASTESYKAVDSALCYACHTDVPFKQETSTGTNFMYHFKHVSAIAGANGSGPTASIDTPGAGKGDAICAECHYRLHSTTYALTGQTSDGKRLVNFSPNVLPRNGVIKFTSTSTGHGTCTLVCHGKSHNAQPY
jgi:predicted CXXCH cytochrome family protein